MSWLEKSFEIRIHSQDELEASHPSRKLTVFMFENVKNSPDLLKSLAKGDIQAAFLNPKYVLNIDQILIAANIACHREHYGKRKTKNIHSELVFCISNTTGIVDSFKTFGILNSSTELIVAVFDDARDVGLETIEKLKSNVQGQSIPLDKIGSYADTKAIQSVFKIDPKEVQVQGLANSVISRIAIKTL